MKNFNLLMTLLLVFLISFFVGCPNGETEKSESTKNSLTKIEITTLPTKTEYFIGDSTLDLAGLKVIASYDNGNTKDVTAEVKTSGFNSSKEVESQTITVTYNGKTATFIIKIKYLYAFHETVTALPLGIDGTYGTDGEYVEFGDWPQEIVPTEVVKSLNLENSEIKVLRGDMQYVQGTDGNYYVKCEENAYINTLLSSTAPTYSDNTPVGEDGKTSRWFKVMPIKWRIVDSNYDVDGSSDNKTAKLLVAENILTAMPYYDTFYSRTIGNETIIANNYMHSQIRAFLNGLSYQGNSEEQTKWNGKGFLQTAFGEKAKNEIVTTKVDNSAKQMSYDASHDINEEFVCPNTEDKIFLLSEYEVVKYSKEEYSKAGKGNSRIRSATDFALANGAYKGSLSFEGAYWWLRSPCFDNEFNACYVESLGSANQNTSVYDQFRGVVPVLAINF